MINATPLTLLFVKPVPYNWQHLIIDGNCVAAGLAFPAFASCEDELGGIIQVQHVKQVAFVGDVPHNGASHGCSSRPRPPQKHSANNQ